MGKTIVKIIDDYGYTWLWDGTWVDVEYLENEVRPEGSGYLALSWEEVLEVLHEGGYVDDIGPYQ
jgi:hypothetical protein